MNNDFKILEYNIGNGRFKLIKATDNKLKKFLGTSEVKQHPFSRYTLAKLCDADPTHKACINLKKTLVPGIGYVFLNKETESKNFQDFIKAPNLDWGVSFGDILLRLWSDWETFGELALECVKIKNSVAIYHHNVKDLYIKVGKDDNPLSYHQITKQDKKKNFALMTNDMKDGVHYIARHINYTPLNYYYGLPDYLAAQSSIAENILIKKFGIKFFTNDASPRIAILVSGGDVSETTLEKLATLMRNTMRGVDNSHKLLALTSPKSGSKIEIQELSKSLDGAFLDERRMNRDEIAQVHQVPPKLIGISSAGSLGSGSELIGAMKSFIEVSIKPRQTILATYINNVLYSLFGFNPQIQFKNIDLTTAKDDAVIYSILSKIADKKGNAAITPLEIRERNGMPKQIGTPAISGKINNNDGDAKISGENTQSSGTEMGQPEAT